MGANLARDGNVVVGYLAICWVHICLVPSCLVSALSFPFFCTYQLGVPFWILGTSFQNDCNRWVFYTCAVISLGMWRWVLFSRFREDELTGWVCGELVTGSVIARPDCISCCDCSKLCGWYSCPTGGGGGGVGHEYASRGCLPTTGGHGQAHKTRLMEALLSISWGFCFVCDLQHNPSTIYPRDSTMESWLGGQTGRGAGETGRAGERASAFAWGKTR